LTYIGASWSLEKRIYAGIGSGGEFEMYNNKNSVAVDSITLLLGLGLVFLVIREWRAVARGDKEARSGSISPGG
jgi:hypothetical protein